MNNKPIIETTNVPPEARRSLRVAFEAFANAISSNLTCCVPACVYSYDRKTRIAQVVPLIKRKYKDASGGIDFSDNAPISVTVRQINCGGFSFDIPLYVGDTGWVVSSDRNTSLIKQPGRMTASVLNEDRPQSVIDDEYQDKPNTDLKHSLESGFFIPDCWGILDLKRVKDLDEEVSETDLYIGTRVDTADKYQTGKEYEKSQTCSITMTRDGRIAIANSGKAEDGWKSMIVLDGDGVTIKSSDGAEDDAVPKIRMTHGDSTIRCSVGDCSIEIGKDGIFVHGKIDLGDDVTANGKKL